MKKYVTILCAAALLFSANVFAQTVDKHIYLEIESIGGFNYGYDTTDTVIDVPGEYGFYISIYVKNIENFIGYDFKIAFDSTNISVFEYSQKLAMTSFPFTVYEEGPTNSNEVGFISKFSDGSSGSLDTFQVAHTLSSEHAGVDIGSDTYQFIGRFTFMTSAAFLTSDQRTFTITQSEIAIKDGIELKTEYVSVSGLHNCAMNGASVPTSPSWQWTPVEITSFFGETVDNRTVQLSWKTASEINYLGFDVMRSTDGITFEKIGSVEGHGTTNVPQEYSFTDAGLVAGEYFYRLKQIDYDGTFTLSDIISVTIGTPDEYELRQNYPNPFNPTTTIPFTLKETGKVKLTIFNILGQEVQTLVNRELPAGVHTYMFDAAGIASGMYFYRLEANGFSSMKKFVILR